MTAKIKSFMCMNGYCGDEDTGRHAILHYEDKTEELIVCPECENVYIQYNGDILLLHVNDDKNEYTIDGFTALQTFKGETNNTRGFFPKLIIKNIHSDSLDGELISFSNCRIDELIIEDTDITSSYYPISFFDCCINIVSFKNIGITIPKLKDYYSTWEIYGIHFFNCVVKDSFSIGEVKASMMISACHFECDLEISKRSSIKLAMLHNDSDPEIRVHKNSKVTQIYSNKGRSTGQGENITTTGNQLKGLSIDELIINPDLSDKTIIEDCVICSISLPKDGTIKGELEFNNCYIGSIQNNAYCFESNIVFLGCTFAEYVWFAESKFLKSLVFEACNFRKEVKFIELKIEKEFHLSFSHFQKDLQISQTRLEGYFYSLFIKVGNKVHLDSLVFPRGINFKNVISGGDFIVSKCDIPYNLLLKNICIGGNLEIKWSDLGNFSLENALVSIKTNIHSVKIKEDFSLVSNKLESKNHTFLEGGFALPLKGAA